MFQLKKVQIQGHPILGSMNVDMSVVGGGCPENGIMTTVMIGPNGVGKSHLLRVIIEIFRYVEAYFTFQRVIPLGYKFDISYDMDGVEYEFFSRLDIGKIEEDEIGKYLSNDPVTCIINKHRVGIVDSEHFREMVRLPEAIIATAMTVTDRYLTPSQGRYYYRGVRSETTPSTTGTRTIIRNTVTNLISCLKTKATWFEELKKLLNALGLQQQLEIRYKIYYENVFLTGDMTPERLKDIYHNQKQYFPKRGSDVWGTEKFRSIEDNVDALWTICIYLNKLFNEPCELRGYSKCYDVIGQKDELVSDSEAINLLSRLGILQYPEIRVFKNNDGGYEFSESSTGELQLFCQLVSIMSAITNNSLVLIDEPENSLHPNWQIHYIDMLQQTFRMYRNAHLLISTHSHFLLTDLDPQWSRIICLKRNEIGVEDVAEGVNTYCWSVDEILYKVFQMRNTRNRIFEKKLYQLYDYISNDEMDKKEAQKLLAELKKYKLSDEDPLNDIIKMAE